MAMTLVMTADPDTAVAACLNSGPGMRDRLPDGFIDGLYVRYLLLYNRTWGKGVERIVFHLNPGTWCLGQLDELNRRRADVQSQQGRLPATESKG